MKNCEKIQLKYYIKLLLLIMKMKLASEQLLIIEDITPRYILTPKKSNSVSNIFVTLTSSIADLLISCNKN